MIKSLLTYSITFTLLYYFGFNFHNYLLENQGVQMRFSLEKIYQFHAFFAALICVNLKLAATVKSIFTQLGFIYLALLFAKILLFVYFLYKDISALGSLQKAEEIALLLPLFIFLIVETIFVVKILNSKN